MKMKHIRWIAVVGLIAIVELQYVWLVNTYKLTRENVMRQSHELFKDAALQETFCRMSLWKQLYGKKDSTYTYQFKLEEEVEDSDTLQSSTPETREFIESAVFIALQEGVLNTFKMDVSLHRLDSIYTHLLDSVGISAKVSTCMTDSLGNVLQASSPQAKLEGQKYLKTQPVALDMAHTRYLQGVILNPYWVIFQRMTLLLIATVLIMALVIVCIVYQIRVIIRQDKIAKVREDFSYAMIHDMKTPLSSILMGTGDSGKRASGRTAGKEGTVFPDCEGGRRTSAGADQQGADAFQIGESCTEIRADGLSAPTDSGGFGREVQGEGNQAGDVCLAFAGRNGLGGRGISERSAQQPDRQCLEVFG